jgi:hypothetical protein
MKTRKKASVGIVLAALLVLGVMSAIATVATKTSRQRAEYAEAYRLAYQAYRDSRPHAESLDQYDFVTRGIPCGASEKEVDAILRDATRKSVLTKMEKGDLMKLYEVVYQPEFKEPGGKPQRIVTETFFVRFKPNDGAYRLERSLAITGDSPETGTTKWDLCSKRRIE